MDEFGWGNTRLVIGEGKDRKVLVNEDDVFHESMIPMKKFSRTCTVFLGSNSFPDFLSTEYEAETWEGSHQGDYYSKAGSHMPPGSRAQSPYGSQAGDFYRDTNAMESKKDLRTLRSHPSQASLSQYGGGQPQPPMSQYGAFPQLPVMPFGSGYAGSAAGSDYGGAMPMGMPYQQTGSVYGMMPPGAPRNTMMSFNMYGGATPNMGPMSTGQSVTGAVPPSISGGGMGQPRMSTFSLATSVNPFAGPSDKTDPTDEELVQALRNYLSTQDLMTVTKK